MAASGAATTLGMGAILLWSTLATLTTLKGPVPPFQTTTIVFTIGAAVSVLVALLRGRLYCIRPTAASLALGIYGLFGYHALYFAALKLAPPAEAHLISSLWALLTVLLSGLLPGAGLRLRHVLAAFLGMGAAAILVWDQLDLVQDADAKRMGFALALGCALVWSTYSVGSRLLAGVPSESIAVSCLATAALAFVCSLLFEQWTMPADRTAWLALVGLGLGPVGAAFLLWDIGMKGGSVPLLGVLSYASPIISTGLLMALGFAAPTWALAVACLLMVIAGIIAAGTK
jgi:drug/metabolite transporter (DMT)-like permease